MKKQAGLRTLFTGLRKTFAFILALIMLLGIMPLNAMAVIGTARTDGAVESVSETDDEADSDLQENSYNGDERERPNNPMRDCETEERLAREAIEYDILTGTLDGSVGMQGFEGAYALGDDPSEIVEIIVQFVTPPSVALRLMEERGISRGRMMPSVDYEAQALAAHAAFEQQLWGDIMLPLGAEPPFEIFGRTHRLFNGVHMRVPSSMVMQISMLPETFAVTPYIIQPLPEIQLSQMPHSSPANAAPTPSSAPSSFFVNPARMEPAARELFSIDYIHSARKITGHGVRVASIDTGVCPNHQEFHRFLDPNGRIRGWELHVHEGQTVNWADTDGHGTLTAGSIISMAPEIELYSFRRDYGGALSRGLPSLVALDLAESVDADVIYTWGWTPHHPFTPESYAVSLAVLNGRIVVAAAHNAGPAPFSIMQPLSPLAINVGAGTAGSDNVGLAGIDDIADFSGRGPVEQTYHIKPDIIAPGVDGYSTDLNNGYRMWGGTSRSSPITTGIVALLVQAFPNAEPWEIKARLMNTARPLADVSPNSVFTVGAGFVNPLDALIGNDNAFATVMHPVPVPNINDPGSFVSAPHHMASLSFGLVDSAASNTSDPMTITIHNPGTGTWTPQVVFNGSHGAVNLNVVSSGANTFTARMTFPEGTLDGFYEGNLIFTNGNRRITMPFAAFIAAPPQPFTLTVEVLDPSSGEVMVWTDSFGDSTWETGLISTYVYSRQRVNLWASPGFSEWEIIEGDVSINYNPGQDGWVSAWFIMPNENVKIRALFESPAIITSWLPVGIIGEPYEYQIQTINFPAGVTWTSEGVLPFGLTFDVNTGTISGIPTTLGTYNFTVWAGRWSWELVEGEQKWVGGWLASRQLSITITEFFRVTVEVNNPALGSAGVYCHENWERVQTTFIAAGNWVDLEATSDGFVRWEVIEGGPLDIDIFGSYEPWTWAGFIMPGRDVTIRAVFGTQPVMVGHPTVTPDGRRIILTFSEPLSTAAAHRPTAAQLNQHFTVMFDGASVNIGVIEVVGNQIILTMTEAALRNQEVKITYTGATTGNLNANRIRDPAGNMLVGIPTTEVLGTNLIERALAGNVVRVANTKDRLGFVASVIEFSETVANPTELPIPGTAVVTARIHDGNIEITSVSDGAFSFKVSGTVAAETGTATIIGEVLRDGSIRVNEVLRYICMETQQGTHIIDYENETITFIGPIRFAFTNNHITIPTWANLTATIRQNTFDQQTPGDGRRAPTATVPTTAHGTVPEGEMLTVNITTRLNNSTNANRQTLYIWDMLDAGNNLTVLSNPRDVNELRRELFNNAPEPTTLMRDGRDWMDMFSVNYDVGARRVNFSVRHDLTSDPVVDFTGRTVELSGANNVANAVANFATDRQRNHETITNFNPFYASGVVDGNAAFVPLPAIPTANVNLQARLRGCNNEGVFATAPFVIQVLTFANANKWTAGGVANFVEYNGARLGTDPRGSDDGAWELAVSGGGAHGFLLEEHVNWLRASGSSIARWRTPNDGHTYHWQISGESQSHEIIDGEPLPPRLYNHIDRGAANQQFRIVRAENTELGLPEVASANNFRFAQLPTRQNTAAANRTLGTIPHNNTFEFLVVNWGGEAPDDVHNVNAVLLDPNVPPPAPHIVQTWTRVPGTAINIQSNWAGMHIYVRRAATATAPHGTLVNTTPTLIQSTHVPARINTLLDAGRININDMFIFAPATGRLTINPNIPNELIILGFARNSAIEISQNGNFWFAAGNTDIRPFLSGAGQGYHSIYVRLRGNANTAPSDALDISINLQTASIKVG